jgi:hypothetical protein
MVAGVRPGLTAIGVFGIGASPVMDLTRPQRRRILQ